jgi:quaternary ammonium compound-resistance protein SugE
MSPWLLLIVAGVLEVGWALGLKLSHGFTRPLVSAATIACMVASLGCLGLATKSLPIGTAYAVWVGIGAAGAAAAGVIVLGEPLTLARAFFMALLIAAIVGLKATA